MPSPLLYEVNTRVWLRELSEEQGRSITLADVPDTEIERWKQLGFTHIWLMGVWQIGPKAREVALTFWREHWSRDIPSAAEDVIGSPYAIEEYSVDSRLGDALSLLMLKERLGRAGLRLILDFVPNHLGIDSTEPTRFPVRFVHSTDPAPGTFEAEARFGNRYFAHGKDPYFDPWIDTVQLDYRVFETHQAMRAVAQTASMYGDGLRCDMAMLLLPEVFAKTWKNFPSQAAHKIDTGFWRKTIQEIRQVQPHVELIAEAYWDREEQLQELGFDYTYNKRVCDYLKRGQYGELLEYIGSVSPGFLNRSVHFIENHDEERAASVFTDEQHKLAAATVLFLPGMALLHDGQLEGRKAFARIQVTKRVPEEADPLIASFYETLLTVLQRTHVRRGKPKLTTMRERQALVVEWGGPEESDFAIINFGAEPVALEVQGGQVLYSTGSIGPQLAKNQIVVAPRSAAIVRGAGGKIG
jgi:hypothetical protein